MAKKKESLMMNTGVLAMMLWLVGAIATEALGLMWSVLILIICMFLVEWTENNKKK